MEKKSHLFSEQSSYILWIGLLILFIAGICAPRLLAFLPPLMGLGFVITAFIKHKNFLQPQKEEIFFIIGVIALAFISSLWAPIQDFSIERSIKITSILLPGIFLLSAARKFEGTKNSHIFTAVILYLFIAALLLFEKTSDHFLLESALGKEVFSHKLNRSYVVFVLFSVPILSLIQAINIEKNKKIILSVFAVILSLVSLSVTESQTAQLCFLMGIGFLYLFPTKPKALLKTLCGLVLISVFAFPFLMKPLQNTIPKEILLDGILKEASIIHRLEVWNHASEQALESPIYGNGIESLRFLVANERMEYQRADTVLHAHNAALQIWVEFGVIGILLAIIMLFYIFRNIEQTENLQQRKLYLASFMTCLCCALTGYGLWQGWQLGLFIFIAAITIASGNYIKAKT